MFWKEIFENSKFS